MKPRLRILWLKSGPLHPLDTGGKIRTYNMMRELKKKHDITFLALCLPGANETTKTAAEEFSHHQIWIPWKEARKRSAGFFFELGGNFLFSQEPYVIQKYLSWGMADKIRELDSSNQFDLIICDFLTPAINLFARNHVPKTPTLLFQHNVESLIWKRLFENATGILKRVYLKGQWKRMEMFERKTCKLCNVVIGVSEDDCHILKTQFGLNNVLGSVPTGVDCFFFQPSAKAVKPHSLVFLGSMDWMPNVDAVLYFAGNIFPAIKERFTDATFTIVGRNPTQQVKDLERSHNGISVTGTVADVRPHLSEAEIMVLPLRVGGGTRIKIFEGMAMNVPIVSTTIGAEGLPVADRQNILLADSSEDFVRSIFELFEKIDLRKQIGTSGRALVERHFGWESVTNVFERYCFEARSRLKR